jgi:hypothetical protein
MGYSSFRLITRAVECVGRLPKRERNQAMISSFPGIPLEQRGGGPPVYHQSVGASAGRRQASCDHILDFAALLCHESPIKPVIPILTSGPSSCLPSKSPVQFRCSCRGNQSLLCAMFRCRKCPFVDINRDGNDQLVH